MLSLFFLLGFSPLDFIDFAFLHIFALEPVAIEGPLEMEETFVGSGAFFKTRVGDETVAFALFHPELSHTSEVP